MFTWICPQCGTEVPPSYSECPRCAEKGKTAPAAAPPAPPDQQPGPPPAPSAAPQVQYVVVRRGPPGWLVTLGVAGGLLLGGWLLYGFLTKRGEAGQTGSPAATPFETPPPVSTPAGAAAGEPQTVNLAKHVEAAGIRIIEERKKPQLRIMIVNHSAADLADLAGTIVIKAKEGQNTVGTLEFKLPELRSYEAKEIGGPLTTKLRAYEMPDWQFLHAELELKNR